jgi:uncharacterized protein (DUF736 family)
MSINIGLTGITYIKTQTAVGTSGRPIRVFDIALATTAGVGTCGLWNGTSTLGTQYISVHSANPHFNSNVGLRFPDGCFAWVAGTSAIVNYIEEF